MSECSTHGKQKRVPDLLEVDCQAIVSYLTQVLETELGSSESAVHVRNHGASCPVSNIQTISLS